jgi:hypothetical protein
VTGLGSRERPGEEDEALVGERVHEGGVIAGVRLCGDASVDPAGARLADDDVVAHRARAMSECKVLRSA